MISRPLILPALQRFAEKCAFDPTTGCVMWIGGQTSGHGHNQPYGAFWFGGRRWFAHRWAAHFIHGLNIAGHHVDHCCPCGPSTLCVEHVRVTTPEENRKLQAERKDHRCAQNPLTRQYWLLIQKGFESYEPARREILDIPWYDVPKWYAPFLFSETESEEWSSPALILESPEPSRFSTPTEARSFSTCPR